MASLDNPYVGRLSFIGRLTVCRLIQKRVAHVQHVHTHYCNSLHQMMKELMMELQDLYKEKVYSESSNCFIKV